MIETLELFPGISLHCCRDTRFKQSCFSVQFIRPMCRQEAAVNTLIPAILLRGCKQYPDLRAITLHLDDLYGAAVGAACRRVGDYQTTGLCCGIMEDRFALEGDTILQPMVDFVRQLLSEPLVEHDGFCADITESEKNNLISAIKAMRNDKRAYATNQLYTIMCQNDSFGVPRMGSVEDVQAITPQSAFAHYQHILKTSPVELFYVGAASMEQVAQLFRPLFADLERSYVPLPPQTGYRYSEPAQQVEQMDVTQGKLAMGFVTPVTIRDEDFAAMQVCNTVLGAGMTGKLFSVIREKMSLCYDIGSVYQGTKGIITVSAGIDFDKETTVKEAVLEQLDQCCRGNITQAELDAAKMAIISQLRTTHDSAVSIESYYGSSILNGLAMTPGQYMEAVEKVDVEKVAQMAKTLQLHSVYFLKGVGA